MPRRPPRRPTDRWKGTKPSFFRVRPPTPDVASTMFAILADFFERPSTIGQAGDGPPNGGGGDPLPEVLLESLAVLYITATFSEEMVFQAGSFTLQKVRVQG